jgi:hypothetical protein
VPFLSSAAAGRRVAVGLVAAKVRYAVAEPIGTESARLPLEIGNEIGDAE